MGCFYLLGWVKTPVFFLGISKENIGVILSNFKADIYTLKILLNNLILSFIGSSILIMLSVLKIP